MNASSTPQASSSPELPELTYTLDDTLVGRLAPAVVAGTIVALPDYVECPLKRGLITVGLIAAGIGVSIYATTVDDNPDNDPQVVRARLQAHMEAARAAEDNEADGPVTTWAKIGGSVAGGVVAVRATGTLVNRFSALLERSGLARARTALGVATGVGVYALGEAMQRNELARAQEEGR